MGWRDKILSDPQILRGKACINGTRIPATLVLGYLAAGRETEAILKEFLDLTAASAKLRRRLRPETKARRAAH
jgi:uncharacterized protein (DUF433 family)